MPILPPMAWKSVVRGTQTSARASIACAVQVRIEMQLRERNSPVVIAESDATESYKHYTQMLLVIPIGYASETLGRATDRAPRRALFPLSDAAVSNSVARG